MELSTCLHSLWNSLIWENVCFQEFWILIIIYIPVLSSTAFKVFIQHNYSLANTLTLKIPQPLISQPFLQSKGAINKKPLKICNGNDRLKNKSQLFFYGFSIISNSNTFEPRKKRHFLPHNWSDKGFEGIVVDRA